MGSRNAATAAGVFVAGNLIGPTGLAVVAMEQARAPICHAFGFEPKSGNDLTQSAPTIETSDRFLDLGDRDQLEEIVHARSIDFYLATSH